jgi:tRNA A-37 threonylcarbamoyl transferase component Bud32
LSEMCQGGCQGVRWRMRPDEELGRLLGPGGLRLTEWLACGAARVLKQAPLRSIYRVVLPGLDFHLKHYPEHDGRAWLRALVRHSKARREFDRIAAVLARGVPTVEPLAAVEIGPPAGPRGSYLLTRTLPDAVGLDVFLEAPPPWHPARRARFRQRLAVALGRFLAQVHEAGITHHDLHAGNILLHLDADDRPELYLIDLHAVHLGPPLPWPAARDNLVILNRWFSLRSERGDRLRFWQAYRAARAAALPGGGRHDPFMAGTLVRDLECRTLRSNLGFWRDCDRRCLGGNRRFRRVRRGDVAGCVVADLDDAVLAPFLADPEAAFSWAVATGGPPVAVLQRQAGRPSVVEFDLATAAGLCRVVYKRFTARGKLEPLAALVRPTPALRSYVLGHALSLRCLPTPRALGVWHRYRGGLPCEGYLLTEKVPDAVDLRTFVDRLAGAGDTTRLRRLIDQVARLVRLLHQRHLSHRDLKAANLLVSPMPAVITYRGIAPLTGAAPVDGTDQVWFIDLVGAQRHGKLGRRRRVQNLARLHASFWDHPGLSRTDRLRFLRVYLAWGLLGRYGWKRWWRQVEEATGAKVRRNLRSGRPLG